LGRITFPEVSGMDIKTFTGAAIISNDASWLSFLVSHDAEHET